MRSTCILVFIILAVQTSMAQTKTTNLLLSVSQIYKYPFNCAGDSPRAIINLSSISNGSVSYILIEKRYCDNPIIHIDDQDFYPAMSVINKKNIQETFDGKLPTNSLCYIICNKDDTTVNINYSLNIECTQEESFNSPWIFVVLMGVPIASLIVYLCQKYINKEK
jgi:hypothetical protein